MRTAAVRMATALALCTPVLCNAETGVAVAHMPHGMSLTVMDSALSCNGGPTAIVNDHYGKKTDQTCNVHFTSDGVRVLFADYGQSIFFSKDQFVVVRAP